MAKDMRKRDMTGMDGKRNGEGFRRKEAVGGGAKLAKHGGNGGDGERKQGGSGTGERLRGSDRTGGRVKENGERGYAGRTEKKGEGRKAEQQMGKGLEKRREKRLEINGDGGREKRGRINGTAGIERKKDSGEAKRGGGFRGNTSGVKGAAAPARGKKSLCPVFKQCGGCQMLDMEYEKQLEWKRNYLEEQLKGLCPVKGIIGMKDPYHYRNKVHAVFDRDRRGNIISGIYQENSHVVVPVERCLIEDQKADEIIGTIRGMLKSFKIRTYDEDTGFGLLRHVLVRRGFATGEIMVVLVTASPVFPSKNNFVKALREKHPEITTIVQNVNGRGTSMVLGEKEHVLYGKGYIEDLLCGCRFRISSKSFYQVNPVQTEVLYGKALELAGLTGKETVLDAYCGIGTIGLIASRKAGSVIGVELNKDAVKDAVNNAKINGITNAKFYCNDAGKFLVDMAERGDKVDLVIMDPPRSGSTEEFMESVARMGVKKVVYVSCNPETLGRDLRVMKKLGYGAVEGWGVDMFGGTRHVETVVLLSKGEVDSKKIRVEFSLEDMDMSEFQDGATYPQIKEYVLEHTGLKVSNLYISQIKRKCGIEVGKNYNLPKSEDSRQPQCPPEKEKAIREAFKYFGMI